MCAKGRSGGYFKILREFSCWSKSRVFGGQSIKSRGRLGCFITVLSAVLYRACLWPDCLEHEAGAVSYESCYSASSRSSRYFSSSASSGVAAIILRTISTARSHVTSGLSGVYDWACEMALNGNEERILAHCVDKTLIAERAEGDDAAHQFVLFIMPVKIAS